MAEILLLSLAKYLNRRKALGRWIRLARARQRPSQRYGRGSNLAGHALRLRPHTRALLEPTRLPHQSRDSTELQQLVPEGAKGATACPFSSGEPPNEMPSYDAVL